MNTYRYSGYDLEQLVKAAVKLAEAAELAFEAEEALRHVGEWVDGEIIMPEHLEPMAMRAEDLAMELMALAARIRGEI